jgi:peptidylprolyl isomerase
MLVCPPATGFPNGNPTPSITAGDTVVFVVDLMFAAPNS